MLQYTRLFWMHMRRRLREAIRHEKLRRFDLESITSWLDRNTTTTMFFFSIDINECIDSPCGPGECVNLMGSHQCICPKGYEQSGDAKSCIEINECVTNPNLCDHGICENVPGSYYCNCSVGFKKTETETCAGMCLRYSRIPFGPLFIS